jgi:hypothetical protein
LLVQDFGEKKDRKLWGEIHQVLEKICRGRIDAALAARLYVAAMKRGRNRGAYWWGALQRETGQRETAGSNGAGPANGPVVDWDDDTQPF